MSVTHYERLGIKPNASADEVRFAYRRLARVYHPDAGGDQDSAEMAELNSAWRALSDPGRRRMYDASLRNGDRPTVRPAETQRRNEEKYPVTVRLESDSPHFPVRWMIFAGIVVMVLIVIAGNVVSGGKTSPTARPMIQPGSCLKVLENLDVSVVDCSEPHDGVTVSVIAFTETCPADLETHRDRQGLGFACMRRTTGPPTS